MLKKILVANRGEIAVRIFRACRDLGIESVAVYSDLDRDALHVRLADEAYALGGQSTAESYLNSHAILAAIEQSGADGVHPGYGFFSENADFARTITERGVTFVGPPPEAIEVMGDKISARHAAERVGVVGVPGTSGFLTDPAEARAFGADHGYPIAVKAAYGGGGRGMKVVAEEAEIESAIESAQREALSYFGRDEIYIERYLTRPRHVEVQIMADSHGTCLYFGTRDCSAQRRHQKLIEEAPAPDIAPDIIEAMGQAAVAVAEGCEYVGAGTVEFLYEDGAFYYLEMNTRLQVEHPATELITGLDLVALQIGVASGERLGLTQSDVSVTGHAIEVRINAEDPANGAFTPSPGTITALRAPDGYGTRFDTGYESGDVISPYYDNLIGKLICWAPDRDGAVRRTRRALDELVVEGVATTVAADMAILSHPDFMAVEHSTKWVEESLDLSHLPAFAPAAAPAADPSAVRRELGVEVDGQRFQVTMWVPQPTGASGRPRRASSAGSGGSIGSGEVAVPMQGTIVKVLVAVGDEVEAGQAVVVLEAMKMENNINADKAGTISEVKVAPGDSVGGGDVVVVVS